MKEAFLAALLSVGPGPDQQIELMEIVIPLKHAGSQVTEIRQYVPAITAADTKADVKPGVVRHLTTNHS